MTESDILKAILPTFHGTADTIVGPGDDCAVLKFGDKYLLAAADGVISSVHYLPETPPEKIAAKLLKRNLSDIAAMGGVPRWALNTLAVRGRSDEWLQRFFAGLEECAVYYNLAIAGGDLAELPFEGEAVSLTILGEVEIDKVCLRKNARPGDVIMVTGSLGDTFESDHHLDFLPRLAEGRFLGTCQWTNCMMDISDGLAADLPKLLAASGCGAQIELDKLPCRNNCSWQKALSDGEDYELLFTVRADLVEQLCKLWPFKTALHSIGLITDKTGNIEYTMHGRPAGDGGVRAYEHFRT